MAFAFTNSNPVKEEATLEEMFREVFDPIVKPSMKESWENNWKQWFVTTKEISDERKPGKVFFEIWIET